MVFRRAGIGAGAVIIGAGGGIKWRVTDQGVFATDAELAYTAWSA